MWLLGTMGCGRSKSASSNAGGGGGGAGGGGEAAADADSSDFYQKAPTGQSQKESVCSSDEGRHSRNKTHNSQGDNNHRMKGQHTNGEVKSTKDSKDVRERTSSGPLAPNAPQQNEESRRSEVNPSQKNITDSQIEFFRMLDEKIEKGRDYDGLSEQ